MPSRSHGEPGWHPTRAKRDDATCTVKDEPKCPEEDPGLSRDGKKHPTPWLNQETNARTVCKQMVWDCGVHHGACMRSCVTDSTAYIYRLRACHGMCDPQLRHCYKLVEERWGSGGGGDDAKQTDAKQSDEKTDGKTDGKTEQKAEEKEEKSA